MDEVKCKYLLPVNGAYRSVRLRWRWRRLKWVVAAASEAAQGHEANGVRPGSQEFKTLYNEVAKQVQAYSSESCIPIDKGSGLALDKLP